MGLLDFLKANQLGLLGASQSLLDSGAASTQRKIGPSSIGRAFNAFTAGGIKQDQLDALSKQQDMENQLRLAKLNAPQKRTSLQRDLIAAGFKPGTPEFQRELLNIKRKPQSVVNVGDGRSFKIPTGFMLSDEKDPAKGVVPIPGGPKDILLPESASKVQSFKIAKAQIPKINKLLFKNGKIDRVLLATAAARVPGTKGRLLDSLYDTGIQAITRGETGAAMPPSELANTRKRFQPSVLDDDETVRIKFEMYKEFVGGALKLLDPSGRFNDERFQTEFSKRKSKGTPNLDQFFR